MTKKHNIVRKDVQALGTLIEGARFVIPSLKDEFRNLRVCRHLGGCTLVSGQVKSGEVWHQLGASYTMSKGTEVVKLNNEAD